MRSLVTLVTYAALLSQAVAAEENECSRVVRSAAREYLPKLYRAQMESDRLLIKNALNAKVELAMAYETQYGKGICEISFKDEFSRVYWELEHGVFEAKENASLISIGKRAVMHKTSSDRECSMAVDVKKIVRESAASAYFVEDKRRHDEEILKINVNIAKLVFGNNLPDAEKDACGQVGAMAYQNFVKAVESKNKRK